MNTMRASETMEYPQTWVEVSSLALGDGRVLTVWMGDLEDEGGRTQVELRVLPNGKREVFISDGASVLDFSDWYGMRATEGDESE